MAERSKEALRKVSVVAATVISLACGTNYIYSAWAPQFAARLNLSSTQSNLIGVFGNLGMYASGIPVGLLVDAKGPRLGVLGGSVALGVGYYPLYQAYNGGPGSMAMAWLCLFSFLTGAGGCAAFAASVKTSALNYPNHRGTATAFPLAAFGLSAFFFSSISTVAFPDNTADFLLMLAIGTFCMIFFSSFFLRVIPHSQNYSAIASDEDRQLSRSSPLVRTKSGDSKQSAGRHSLEPDENSSLMSKSSTSIPGDFEGDAAKKDRPAHDPHHLDIRGMGLLPKVEFWLLFSMLGLLTGIGLMTINNIGNDAQALWSRYDRNATPGWIQRRQLMHVSILSVLSFIGRLVSGIGSDLIVKKLHMSRFWCTFISSAIFCGAQLCGALISIPENRPDY